MNNLIKATVSLSGEDEITIQAVRTVDFANFYGEQTFDLTSPTLADDMETWLDSLAPPP